MARQHDYIKENSIPKNLDSENNTDSINKMFYNDEITIPKSLLPENVKKRLENLDEAELEHYKRQIGDDAKHPSGIKRIAIGYTAAAAACIAALLFTNGPYKDTTKSIVTTDAINPYNDEKSNTTDIVSTRETNNYSAAYKSMQKYNKEIENLKVAYAENRDFVEGDSETSGIKSLEFASDDSSSSGKTKASYSDTNVRTLGVDEGDIVKTDGTYIYVLNKNTFNVTIYIADKEKTKQRASIQLKYAKNGIEIRDMYVYKDRLIVTAVKSFASKKQKDKIKALYKKENSSYKNFNAKSWDSYFSCGTRAKYETEDDYGNPVNYTLTFVYDISDMKNPNLLHEFFQDGYYDSSRMVDGLLYLFSSRTFNSDAIDKKDPTSYIPQIGGECVEDADVTATDDAFGTNYAVISSIDTQKCEYIGKHAVLSGISNSLYVSNKHIYLFGQQFISEDSGSKSEIIKLSYKDGKMKKIATGSFKGYILDDYCIDEKDGTLRFVTTYYNKKGKFNGLFIMDKNLKVTGKITKLAKGEEIYSARFIDDTAYFVTYRNTDPLFAVDVSDNADPKMLGYLKIPGFSKYLHPYSDTLLLGIGEETDNDGNNKGLKLSMFDISNPANVKEVAKEVLEGNFDCEAEYNPNALFIDTDKNIFGFGLENYVASTSLKYGYVNKSIYKYMVYSYDEKKGFVRKLNHGIFERKASTIVGDSFYCGTFSRGIYIDDYFYVVTTDEKNIITAFDLKTFDKY